MYASPSKRQTKTAEQEFHQLLESLFVITVLLTVKTCLRILLLVRDSKQVLTLNRMILADTVLLKLLLQTSCSTAFVCLFSCALHVQALKTPNTLLPRACN